MAVTNRGSILISTANDIGSSLVDVIGGEGYTPNEWSKKINLCGIAAADVPTALENIEESTPSGTDRGSISLDTANAVGAVLNKKFNTARGFKPSEWASAISKLTELEVKTASGSVASFDDGADDVPLKSCTCEILPVQDTSGGAPSPSNPCPITGTTEIEVTHTDGQNPPIESETKTVALGRTVLGGSHDFISGELKDSFSKMTLDENGAYSISLGSGSNVTNRIAVTAYQNLGKTNGIFVSDKLKTSDNNSGGFKSDPWLIWGSISAPRMWISVPLTIDTVDKFKAWLHDNPIEVAYELATYPTYNLEGQEISSYLGDNNISSDVQGGTTTVEYRADIDLALN